MDLRSAYLFRDIEESEMISIISNTIVDKKGQKVTQKEAVKGRSLAIFIILFGHRKKIDRIGVVNNLANIAGPSDKCS
jgi:hypothetical protein